MADRAKILPFTHPDRGDVGPQDSSAEFVQQSDRTEKIRMAEAIVFASSEPVSEAALTERLGEDVEIAALMAELQQQYQQRGVNLVCIGGNWAFRTADDLSYLLNREAVELKRLSRAALEVLAIVAYHQPVTRAEIEEIRGVTTSRGTLDVLLETGWIRMRGRRRSPGKPITYGTTTGFLDHFGLGELQDLPGMEELKGAGLLQSNLPSGFQVPIPDDRPDLTEDEDPFAPEELEALGLLPPTGGEGEPH